MLINFLCLLLFRYLKYACCVVATLPTWKVDKPSTHRHFYYMKQEIEVWKPIMIEPFIGKFEVSNLARVRKLARTVYTPNHIRGKIRNRKEFILTQVEVNGYMAVSLCGLFDFRKQIKVHRLVALHFVDNPNNLPQINHIDGNKKNNNATNLEWCDSFHNMRHAHSLGLVNVRKGVDCVIAALNEKQVKMIRRRLRKLTNDIASELNVSYAIVSSVIHNRTYKDIKLPPNELSKL